MIVFLYTNGSKMPFSVFPFLYRAGQSLPWLGIQPYIRAHIFQVPAPGNAYVTPLRFKLGGRPVLSAHLDVETAGSPSENGWKFEPRRVLKPFL